MPLMYVCSLPNSDAEIKGPPHELLTNDKAAIDAFLAREDQPGRGVFFCPNRLKDGATTRSKDTIARVDTIGIDVDFKDIQEDPQIVHQRLAALPCPPSQINNSGHGRHSFFDLIDPVDTNDKERMAVVEQVHKGLVQLLCGDPAVSHHAALLRVVGTTNSKSGEVIQVTMLVNNNIAYHLEDLQDMIAEIEHPIFTPKKVD